MNKLKRWVSDCLKKNKYSQKKYALMQKQEAKQERGVELRVYRCPHCNGWHLTKNTNK